MGSIPGLGISPGEGKGYSLQYSGLKNSLNCIVHGGHEESDTTEQLSLSFTSSLVCYFFPSLPIAIFALAAKYSKTLSSNHD